MKIVNNFTSSDWKTLAQNLRSCVIDQLKKDLESWKNHLDMQQLIVQDAADSLSVCVHLHDGSWHSALNSIRKMDTAPREKIFEFIQQIVGEKQFDLMLMM